VRACVNRLDEWLKCKRHVRVRRREKDRDLGQWMKEVRRPAVTARGSLSKKEADETFYLDLPGTGVQLA